MPGAACGADSERNDEEREKQRREGGAHPTGHKPTCMPGRANGGRGDRGVWGGHEASSADRQSREHTQVVAAEDRPSASLSVKKNLRECVDIIAFGECLDLSVLTPHPWEVCMAKAAHVVLASHCQGQKKCERAQQPPLVVGSPGPFSPVCRPA